MNLESYTYIDGNAAAGELSKIFSAEITTAEGQCANCGAKRRFAEAHLYTVQALWRVAPYANTSCSASRIFVTTSCLIFEA